MHQKTVLIAVIGNVGNEPEALRQSLESFGYLVVLKGIGRPKDLTDILEGICPVDFDYLILACHGENGAIVMPALAENIYLPDEYRENFSGEQIARHLALSGKVIINSGCTTGGASLREAFSRANFYVAPNDYVEGNAAVFFIIHLFYELAKGKALREALEQARKTDEETKLFALSGQE